MQSGVGETVFVEDLKIGMSVSLTKVMDAGVVQAFADVSEDMNPIHLDPAVGAASRFGGCIAHGMLVSSLFSALLGNKLPGNGFPMFSISRPSWPRPSRTGNAASRGTAANARSSSFNRQCMAVATLCW